MRLLGCDVLQYFSDIFSFVANAATVVIHLLETCVIKIFVLLLQIFMLLFLMFVLMPESGRRGGGSVR